VVLAALGDLFTQVDGGVVDPEFFAQLAEQRGDVVLALVEGSSRGGPESALLVAQQQHPLIVVEGDDAGGYAQRWGRHAVQCDTSGRSIRQAPRAYDLYARRVQDHPQFVIGDTERRYVRSFRLNCVEQTRGWPGRENTSRIFTSAATCSR
jgi:hypothetical protein